MRDLKFPDGAGELGREGLTVGDDDRVDQRTHGLPLGRDELEAKFRRPFAIAGHGEETLPRPIGSIFLPKTSPASATPKANANVWSVVELTPIKCYRSGLANGSLLMRCPKSMVAKDLVMSLSTKRELLAHIHASQFSFLCRPLPCLFTEMAGRDNTLISD
ncbi:MAG: hypothetical protein M9920_10370 [Verrucomicrobiae bacterium]|nr:hypothetical protein [Verrucomicrobiae bacterium]